MVTMVEVVRSRGGHVVSSLLVDQSLYCLTSLILHSWDRVVGHKVGLTGIPCFVVMGDWDWSACCYYLSRLSCLNWLRSYCGGGGVCWSYVPCGWSSSWSSCSGLACGHTNWVLYVV